jgi:hypothetical protein
MKIKVEPKKTLTTAVIYGTRGHYHLYWTLKEKGEKETFSAQKKVCISKSSLHVALARQG